MRNLAHILFPILLVLGLLGMPGCNNKKGETTDSGNWPETFLAGLTDTGKAGQVLCYTVDPINYFGNSRYRTKVQEMIKAYPPGAIYLFSDLSRYEKNILSEFDSVKLRGIVTEMQNLVGSPCLFAGSFESGAWTWASNATKFPPPITLGATGSTAFAYRQGKITAVEAVAQGINWILAPVVNNTASFGNTNDFSLCFGADPARIGEFTAQFVKGVQDAEAAACLKFYPGPEMDAERSPGGEPFKAGIAAGALSILGNPFSIASDSSSGNPSLDSCRDILSAEFGFKGVVVREVQGVEDSTLSWTAKAENILKSFAHGQDVVILPDDPDKTLPLLTQLFKMVQVKEADITAILPSVKKIVLLKDKLKLHQSTNAPELLTAGVGIPEYTRTSEDIARASLTLLKNDGNIIPLNTAGKQILFANFIDINCTAMGIKFSENLLTEYPEIHQINVLNADDSRIILELLRRVNETNIVVCTFFLNPALEGAAIQFSKAQRDLLHRISRIGKPCFGVSFSSPFLINDIPEFKGFLTTYTQFPYSLTAASDVLFGKTEVSGKLPMTISARYPLGSGLTLESNPQSDQSAVSTTPDSASNRIPAR